MIFIIEEDDCAHCELPDGTPLYGRDVDDVAAALNVAATNGAFGFLQSEIKWSSEKQEMDVEYNR